MEVSSHPSFRSRAKLLVVSVLVATGLFVAVSQAFASFDAPVNFGLGNGPAGAEFVAVGDLDTDGALDLATANSTSNNVSILLGNGAGSFTAAVESPIAVGDLPRSVAIGNLNAGSVPDLAVTNFLSDEVTILLGDGDGTFTAAAESPIAVGNQPRTVAIGNLDAGSVPDLAITTEVPANVSILLGDGDGTFTAAAGSPIDVGSFPFGIAIGNLDGDTDQDLVVGSTNSNIRILLGNGNGTFTAASGSPIAVSSVPQNVAIGNLNADSVPDVVVVNRNSNNVSVLLGLGSGTFGPKTDFATGEKPQSVAIGNLNADSFLDLAVATTGPDTSGPDDVSVLLGNGDGTFAAKTDFQAGIDPTSVAIANLNGGGSPDLVTANTGDGNVSVLIKTTGPTANTSPDRLDFPSRDVATTSAAQTVTFTNTSDDDQVVVSAVTITDQDAADFTVSSETCSAGPLEPNGTCSVNVTFTPTAVGQRFSNLDIAFNGAASPLTVQLAGSGALPPVDPPVCPEFTTGTPPNCEPIPCPTGFIGNQPACVQLKAVISKLTVTGPATLRKGRTATYKAKITNSGNAQATGVRLIASGRGIRFNARVGTVNPGATRTVNLRIRPSRTGRVKATFKVTSSNAGTRTVRRTVRVR